MSDHPSHPLPDPAALAANWPAPEPDEPESLRQDILDELNDHLQSAYDHELIKTGDNQTAAARVLDRFGDPTAIACQLWWDAMKGPAMRQMLLVVVSAVSTTLSVAALGGLAWFASAWQSADTRLVELQRELAQNATQQQADREALRQELTAQFASQLAARGEASATFLPLKLRVIGEASRRPITQPLSFALTPPLPPPIQKPSDDKGDLIYDFGLVPPGNYTLRYVAAENAPWTGTQSLWVRPGNPEIIETTYPDPDVLKPGRLRIDLGVPDDLRTADLENLRFGIELRGIHYQGAKASWQHSLQLPETPLSKPGQTNDFSHLVVVVDGLGRVVETMGCNKPAREGGNLVSVEYWDNLRFERCVHQPAQDGFATLMGGRYSAENRIWVLPRDVTDQLQFPAQWLGPMTQTLSTLDVEISSGGEIQCSLSNAARERLWTWVRWSGILPATETVAIPLARIDFKRFYPDGLMTAGLQPMSPFEYLAALLKNSEKTSPAPAKETAPRSDQAVWLMFTLSSQVYERAGLKGESNHLSIGRVAVASMDREADTVSVRVNPYQRQLLERLLSIGGDNELSLRIAAGISRFPEDLIGDPFHYAAVLKAVMPTEPARQP